MINVNNIIIDGQILQTSAWYRGMGKYTTQVLTELSKNVSEHLQVSIIFNSNLKYDKERFDTLKFLCPNITQYIEPLPLPANKNVNRDSLVYRKKLNRFIEMKWPDKNSLYLISSLFYFDFFAEFPCNCYKGILFYDLTPLLFWQELGGYFPPDIYMPRFKPILEANIIYCISNTTRHDLLKIFGLNPSKVININGGFTKIADKTIKPDSFKVPQNFILFPTGDIPHKNNDTAVKGFQKYFLNSNKPIPLLITSNFSSESKTRLNKISKNIIFTGNISDEELEWLYEHAEAVLFASKYEGLGMPILDAAASSKPIITSRIPVFEEMSKSAFYYFAPNHPEELQKAIENALQKKSYKSKKQQYTKILNKYTWSNTTEKLLRNINFNEDVKLKPRNKKLKIAVACINPGISHQIGRFAEAMYYCLSKDFHVDYYFDSNGYHYREMERPTFLDFINIKTFDITKLNISSYKNYDCIIYLIDDNSIISRVGQKAAVLPGIVIKDKFKNESEKNIMMRKIINQNQYATISFPGNSYSDYIKLLTELKDKIIQKNKNRSDAELILRSNSTFGGIIRRLKALSK